MTYNLGQEQPATPSSLSLWERGRVRGFGDLRAILRRPSPLSSGATVSAQGAALPARRGENALAECVWG